MDALPDRLNVPVTYNGSMCPGEIQAVPRADTSPTGTRNHHTCLVPVGF
jgi:hypothetical protein